MSFLQDYRILTEGNEAPEIFHRWSCISLLSQAIGRRVWIDWGIVGNLHLNLYIVLVGEPGSKKSTAMKIAASLASQIGLELAGESMTREAITQKMARPNSPCHKVFEYNGEEIKFSQLSICANELINLLNAGGNPIGMIDFMTDIWDAKEYKVETKNKGNDIIVGPYISMLGCLTPMTIQSLANNRVVSGGMTRRCLFIRCSGSQPPNPFPTITPEQQAARERILLHLHGLRNMSGPMIWTQSARECFYELYINEHERKQNIRNDHALAAFLESKPSLILKVAALLALAQEPPSLELTQEDILGAYGLITAVETGSSVLFSSLGRNAQAPLLSSILSLATSQAKAISLKELYLTFRVDASVTEIDDAVKQLVDTEELESWVVQQGKAKTTFVGTKAAKADFVETLHQRSLERAAAPEPHQS